MIDRIYGAGLASHPPGVRLNVQLYSTNYRAALTLRCADDGMPYGSLTTNLPEVQLASDEFVVSAGWNLPRDLAASFLEAGLFAEARHVPYGDGFASVWRIVSQELLDAITTARTEATARPRRRVAA
ncbi:hypothetical protein [Cupriavidus basilensis]